LKLEDGQEYFIGRGSQCHIQLPSEKAISRQHLKLIQHGGVWHIELMSRIGQMILDGQSTGQIQLTGACRFAVPPFDFEYSIDTAALNPTQQEIESPLAQALNDSDPNETEQAVEAEPNFEATQVGAIALVPFLRIKNTQTEEEVLLKLEGHQWTAGRHPSSEIYIDDSAISRKHFEITRTDEGFAILDLGSSNGLLLNGERIEAGPSYPLNSGDQVRVRHIHMSFEIHDAKYQEKVAKIRHLPAVLSSPMEEEDFEVDQVPASTNLPAHLPPAGPAAIRMPPPQPSGPRFQPKTLIMGAVALVLVLVVIFKDDEQQDLASQPVAGGAEKPPEVSKEKLGEAKHLFELAKSYYFKGNHEFCLAQIERLHAIVPSYENSKEIEMYCQQAIELEKINDDRERKERERQQVELRIRNVVEDCKSKITQETKSAEIRLCLQDALELNPEDPDALSLIAMLESKEEQDKIRQSQAEQSAQRRQAGLQIFNQAKRLDQSNKDLLAIAQYRRFLGGNYGLSREETEARSSLNRLEQGLQKKGV
jgi:pSer/pThr/pTyr-binding forkhead associated (FHA) protein